MSELIETEKHFKFFLKLDEFGGEYVSSAVELSGMPWHIKVCKRSVYGKDVIDIFLLCGFAYDELDWFCEAEMSVALQSIVPDKPRFVESLPKTKFTKKTTSDGILAYMDLAELKEYERHGRLCFDVHLSTNPARFRERSDIEQTRVKFRVTAENVSKLQGRISDLVTPKLVLRGTSWRVKFEELDGHLSIFLFDERSPQNKNWSWTVKYSFKLLSFDENIQPKSRAHIIHTFYYKGDNWGYTKYVSVAELMDASKKYVLDDKAVFEIDLNVSPPQPLWDMANGMRKANTEFLECPICLRNVVDRQPCTTSCGHLFCFDCIKQTIRSRRKCPMCNANATIGDLRLVYISL